MDLWPDWTGPLNAGAGFGVAATGGSGGTRTKIVEKLVEKPKPKLFITKSRESKKAKKPTITLDIND